MFDANDTGPKNYDYFSPQQLYKKSDSPWTWHFSIAFQAYAAMFRRGTVCEDLRAKARIKTQTDFLFDARPKCNKTFCRENSPTRKFYVEELFLKVLSSH